MAGDVDDFANEEEAGDEKRLHGLAGKLASVDATRGDFGLFVTFAGSRSERPLVQVLFESSEGRIGVGGGRVEFEPALGEAIGNKLLQGFTRGRQIAMAGGAQRSGGIALRSEVQLNGLGFLPVGGNLEYGGTAETAMGEKHFFAKGIFPGGGDDLGGDSRQLGIAMMIGTIEHERNESGACGNDFVLELASKVVAERSGAHFGDGEAAGGDDKDGSAEFGRV